MAGQLPAKRLEILGFLARGSGGSPSKAPPSIREIARGVGLKSSQTVHHHLGRLEDEGYLERLRDRLRTPRLTEKGWAEALGGDVPLMGRIAAGRGLEAVALEDEVYSLAADLLSSGSGKRRYLLRVVGQSMKEARIEDGDTLVVEEDEDPADGDTVVALLDGGDEVTVKKLYREGDTVRLRPRNGGHEDIVVPAESVRIQGRVLWVFHPPAR